MNPADLPPSMRIVILGAGFSGLYAALELERTVARDAGVEVLLIDPQNFLLFTVERDGTLRWARAGTVGPFDYFALIDLDLDGEPELVFPTRPGPTAAISSATGQVKFTGAFNDAWPQGLAVGPPLRELDVLRLEVLDHPRQAGGAKRDVIERPGPCI